MARRLSAVVALALLAAACGGSSDDGVASLEETPTSANLATSDNEFEQSFLAFTQCLRDEGLDVPDPEFNADGSLQLPSLSGFDGVDEDELVAARDTCSEFLEGVTLENFGFDRTSIEDTLFEYASCMRDNGFDMPDPDLDGFLRRTLAQGEQNPDGAAGLGIFGGDLDFEDPDFIAADEACRPQIFAGFEPPTG